jgi:hypothetical protein
MRFERKHIYYKLLTSSIRNFRNITLSLAERNEAQQCLFLLSFNPKNITSSKICECINDKYISKLLGVDHAYLTQRINIGRLEIANGYIYIYDISRGLPCFCIVSRIIYSGDEDIDKVKIIGRKLITKRFCTRYSYEIAHTDYFILRDSIYWNKNYVLKPVKKRYFVVKNVEV